MEDVSVFVWPHCAVAVSAKKAARLALIVPVRLHSSNCPEGVQLLMPEQNAVKDAAKNGTNDTTPTGLRKRKYMRLRSNKSL